MAMKAFNVYIHFMRASESKVAASDDVWRLQCTCQGCAKDVMAAGALCPMCRSKIQSTITARF